MSTRAPALYEYDGEDYRELDGNDHEMVAAWLREVSYVVFDEDSDDYIDDMARYLRDHGYTVTDEDGDEVGSSGLRLKLSNGTEVWLEQIDEGVAIREGGWYVGVINEDGIRLSTSYGGKIKNDLNHVEVRNARGELLTPGSGQRVLLQDGPEYELRSGMGHVFLKEVGGKDVIVLNHRTKSMQRMLEYTGHLRSEKGKSGQSVVVVDGSAGPPNNGPSLSDHIADLGATIMPNGDEWMAEASGVTVFGKTPQAAVEALQRRLEVANV